MTLSGAIFMVVSWGVIIGLNLFCFSRLTKADQGKDQGAAAD